MDIILIYITNPDKETAQKIAGYLLDLKLIACYNVFPIESSYWWNSAIDTSDEFVSILKTRVENWETIRDEIVKIHPYEVPCILKINVDANENYKKWIFDETDQSEKIAE